jgi:hypothetical protein
MAVCEEVYPIQELKLQFYGGIYMRIGTFLLGGIAGAAAVIYFNRNAKSMMFSAFNSSNTSADTSWKNRSQQQEKTGKMDSTLHQTGNETFSKAEQNSAAMH